MKSSRLVIIAVVIVAGRALGQDIRGRIEETTTGAAIAFASISAKSSDTSAAYSAIASTQGEFLVRVPRTGSFNLTIRRIGYSPVTLSVVVGTLAAPPLKVQMSRLPTLLDTVSTVDRGNGSKLTPGRTFVERHLALKRGVIVSGAEILLSGMRASEYLGRLPGLKLIKAGSAATPLVPAANGQFLTSAFETQCLYARVDWAGLPYLLVARSRETIDDLLRVDEIRAVEVYRTIHETPVEWRFNAVVPLMYSRLNGGTQYWMGHSDKPQITAAMVEDDRLRFGTKLVFDERKAIAGVTARQAQNIAVQTGKNHSVAKNGAVMPNCGFMQIWTAMAW